MLTFLLILALVFIGVDIFVRLVIDPLADKQNKKDRKKSGSLTTKPLIGIVGVTLYDGGEIKDNTDEKKSDAENFKNEIPNQIKES